jgi:hypothetical protein
MVPYIALILSIGILVALGLAALTVGTDSRPSIGDDHLR